MKHMHRAAFYVDVARLLSPALLWCFVCGGAVRGGACAEPPSIALTASVVGKAVEDVTLAESLLSLTQLEVEATSPLKIVERQRLDLALQELALQGGARSDAIGRARLGKILTAELLVALRIEPTEGDATRRRARLQVADARTAEILSLSVAAVSADTLEDVARQLAGDVIRAARRPRKPRVSLAVAPFESVGRFARLRPFELGVRDLLTAALLRRVGLVQGDEAPPDDAARPAQGPSAGDVQILQRTDLGELLRELDLLQSGLVDRERLPANNPTRATSYLVRGTLDENRDERSDDGRWRILVDVEVWHAATGRRVDAWRITEEPRELARQLDVAAERLLRVVANEKVAAAASPRGAERFEIEWLLERTLCDLQRFRRISPIDASTREFPVRARRASDGTLASFAADSPVGRTLLQKSIDRLETVLALAPASEPTSAPPTEAPAGAMTRVRAMLALGACRSFHVDGLGDARAADEWLRKAYAGDSQGRLGAEALTWLAALDFHHQTGARAPGDPLAAAARAWLAFEQMPALGRDSRWARLPELVALAPGRSPQSPEFSQHVDQALTLAQDAVTPHRYFLAMATTELVRRTIVHPRSSDAERAAWRERLIAWTRSADRLLIRVASFRLAEIDEQGGKKREAARWLETGAAALADSREPIDLQGRDNLRIRAARAFREAGDVSEALRVLEAMSPPVEGRSTLNRGYWGVELGRCYEESGESRKALAAYVAAAEECPSVVDNSPIITFIDKLGGVPLDDRRLVDVRYVSPSSLDGKPPRIPAQAGPSDAATMAASVAKWRFGPVLVTDGKRLFLASLAGAGDKRPRLATLDVATQTWRFDEQPFGQITALLWDGDRLWVGTQSQGLWRGLPGERGWRRWGRGEGLPDERVTAIVADSLGGAIVGVGDRTSGGLVRIDREDGLTIVHEDGAPRTAPTSLATFTGRLVATCGTALHESTLAVGTWTQRSPLTGAAAGGAGEVRVFAGAKHAWGSTYGRELFPWNADEASADRCRATWFPAGQGKAGCRIEFVVERDGAVWFGGEGWDRFNSCGLYRFDLASGKFERFGPRDGFQAGTNRTSAGAWAADSLWVVVGGRVARVTPRGPLAEPK